MALDLALKDNFDQVELLEFFEEELKKLREAEPDRKISATTGDLVNATLEFLGWSFLSLKDNAKGVKKLQEALKIFELTKNEAKGLYAFQGGITVDLPHSRDSYQSAKVDFPEVIAATSTLEDLNCYIAKATPADELVMKFLCPPCGVDKDAWLNDNALHYLLLPHDRFNEWQSLDIEHQKELIKDWFTPAFVLHFTGKCNDHDFSGYIHFRFYSSFTEAGKFISTTVSTLVIPLDTLKDTWSSFWKELEKIFRDSFLNDTLNVIEATKPLQKKEPRPRNILSTRVLERLIFATFTNSPISVFESLATHKKKGKTLTKRKPNVLSAKLTNTQKEFVRELNELSILLGYDYQDVESWKPQVRVPYLQGVRDKMIRGQIILYYTLIDEFLSNELCIYFFGRKRGFVSLWKTKKFQRFNFYVIEKLYLLQKLEFVKEYKKIPKKIENIIMDLNGLRNGVVHSFFPENRKKSKPLYKGKNVFSLDGMKLLREDMDQVQDYFWKGKDYTTMIG